MPRVHSRPPYLAAMTVTTLLLSCVAEPVEYLAVQMLVADGYRVQNVLEQARPNQPLTVAVGVVNFGQETLDLEIPCPAFRVTNRSGDVVGPSSASCMGGATSTITLRPGDTWIVETSWAGEDASGTTLPTAAYGLESWTRRTDRASPVETGIQWVCLVPDSTPPPNRAFHDCGLPGDPLPSRNLSSVTTLLTTARDQRF